MSILARSSISNRFRFRAHRRVHLLPIDCLPTFAVRNRVCHLHDCAARPEHQRRMTTVPRLRLVALVEWSKAVLVSFAVAGLLALGGDGLRRLGMALIDHFHLNPANHPARMLIYVTDGASVDLRWVIAIALAYIALRVAEGWRSEEHTSELQSLMRISYA